MEKDITKQSQIGGEGNTQIGRDSYKIINNGLSYGEIKEVVQDLSYKLLIDNFPKLREDALNSAKINVSLFLNKLDRKIQLITGLIDIQRFAEPDLQFSLNDAVQASARKGEDMDLDILTEMVLQKVINDKRNLQSITAEEAIRVLPRLSSKHIGFLTFIQAMTSISFAADNIEELNIQYQNIYELTSNCFGMSSSNKKHLDYVGAISIDTLLKADIRLSFLKTYMHIENLDNDLAEKAPFLDSCINEFNENEIYKIRLTSVGEMIALANLKAIGNVEYSTFITE